MSACWMLPKTPPFVHLGRHGDLMILLPAWKHIFDVTGQKPVVLCSREYSGVLDGVSYVQPWIGDWHWYNGVRIAKQEAIEKYGWVCVPKWWDDPTSPPHEAKVNGNAIDLKIHGRDVRVPSTEWDSYMMSQWRWAGLAESDMGRWPLVFDRRDPMREKMVMRMVKFTGRPAILLNCSGISSPFPHTADVSRLVYSMRGKFDIIDMAKFRAPRIFDLLGLFDAASLIVTTDTSTLHLSSASKVPMIAFVANGGGGSIVNGNALLKIRYGEWPKNRQQFIDTLNSLKPNGN